MHACSSFGQNLVTSLYIGETLYACLVAVFGLVMMATLIAGMQVGNDIMHAYTHAFMVTFTLTYVRTLQLILNIYCRPTCCL